MLQYAQKVAGGARVEKDINELMGGGEGAAADLSEGLLANEAVATRIVYLGGVMPQDDLVAFRRMMVRVSRGKVIVASTDLEIPFDDSLVDEPDYGKGMAVYLLAFEVGDYLMDRVKRIAASFKTAEPIEIQISKLAQALTDECGARESQKKLLSQEKKQLLEVLKQTDTRAEAPDVSALEVYRLFIERELSIHIHMNMLKRSETLAQGLVWVPTEAGFQQKAQNLALRIQGLYFEKLSDKTVDSLVLTRPTKFYSNEFMQQFQYIIDMYGIATYGEANPAVFAIVWFPFLFGVMFGDIFHGSLLLVFAIYLCCSSRTPGTLAGSLGPGRHFLLLMGIFSTFNGFIYNDYSSLSTQAFGYTCWDVAAGTPDPKKKGNINPARKDNGECVYSFGIDPIQFLSAETEIPYLNAFKMKISVIFGVAHMMLGTLVRFSNFIY